MYLSKLKLWNFRKFGSINELIVDKKLRKPDLEVKFQNGLNVLIGENDSGKTAIIDAIKLVLKTHSYEWINLDDDDFYQNTTRLRVQCHFEDLTSNEAKNFIEWLGVEGEGDSAKVYLNVILEAQRNKEKILPFDIKAGIDNEGYPLSAEAKEYLKVTYLKPLRDAKNELVPKRNSRLSQILQAHEIFKGKNDDHELVTEVFKEFCTKIEDYFKNGKDGVKITDTLNIFLEQFFGKKKETKFNITEQKLKNILEILRLTLEDGKLGLGSHNLLFIASELLNLKRSDWDGIRLGLIEELEAHLHPQAQMRIIESLQQQEKVQFILTTHSPNLASKVKLAHLIVCADDLGEKPNVFPMSTEYTKLNEKDYKFLEIFLDITKANLFFAKGVILVEGWSEEILIPVLADKIGINLTAKGVSVINVASTAFLHYAKIFQRYAEPCMKTHISVITDLDVKPIHIQPKKIKNGQEIDRNDKIYNEEIEERKKNINFEELPVKVYYSKEWTLEYCLLKSSSLSKKFEAVVKEVHSKTNFSDFENEFCEKLKEKKLNKTEIAYHLAQIIKEDMQKETQEISLNKDDEYIKYIIDAIKYAANEN